MLYYSICGQVAYALGSDSESDFGTDDSGDDDRLDPADNCTCIHVNYKPMYMGIYSKLQSHISTHSSYDSIKEVNLSEYEHIHLKHAFEDYRGHSVSRDHYDSITRLNLLKLLAARRT